MSKTCPLLAPYPYFGGKARVAATVWQVFGTIKNYLEPFFGSGAVLLGRPAPVEGIETVNDLDAMIPNFWRAVQADPEAVAQYADAPAFECDLHARHAWLVGQKDSLQARLEGDPDYYDAKIAGWWVWGMANWIGSGFCSGEGSWHVVDGQLVHGGDTGQGVQRQLLHLGNTGQGVQRNLLHLGDAGRGVQRGAHRNALPTYFQALAERLRQVRVACGDWSRVLGPAVTEVLMPVGVFLDPPYGANAHRTARIYRQDSLTVADAVCRWAIEHGDDPRYKIVLCGFEGEHDMPASWTCIDGQAGGNGHGYGANAANGYTNAGRERLWLSPQCQPLAPAPQQPSLFAEEP